MKKHLLVVSVDAMVYEDLTVAKDLPFFKYMLENGSMIKKCETIYPSVTHPAHASIMTGCRPEKTGIFSNEIFGPGVNPHPWFNYLSEMKCDTIFHAAKRAGLTVSASRWPMTAQGGDVIDYLVPEVIKTDLAGHEHEPLEVYKTLGASPCILDIVQEAIDRFGATTAHPAYDDFQTYCTCEIIKRYTPDVMFTHPGFVDSERHRTGLFTEEVKDSVRSTDRWLSQIADALKEAGIFENTDIIVLSDHGHLNVARSICPNVYLKEAGLIETDEDGNLKSWDAFVVSSALSGQVHLSRPDDKELWNRVYALLKNMAQEEVYGFTEVFTKEEVEEKYGLSGPFSFVIETDGCTTFREDWERPAVRPLDNEDYRFGHSTHGHLPEKGPQPPFLCCGPSFKKGVVLENGLIINHAPTMAAVLGTELPEAEGRPVTELLR